jgi:hypothetical protein
MWCVTYPARLNINILKRGGICVPDTKYDVVIMGYPVNLGGISGLGQNRDRGGWGLRTGNWESTIHIEVGGGEEVVGVGPKISTKISWRGKLSKSSLIARY